MFQVLCIDNNIGDEEIKVIAAFLKENTSIKKLNLG